MADVEEPIEEPVEETPAVAIEEDFVPTAGATEVKLFGKWSFDDIEISDLSLEVSFVGGSSTLAMGVEAIRAYV